MELSDRAIEACLDGDVVNVRPSGNSLRQWVISAKHLVGVAQLGDLEVRIDPKVGVSRLVELLVPSQDRIQWDQAIEPSLGEAPDLVSMIGAAFAARSTELLRQGLLYGYRSVHDALPTVRGRIETGAQLARRPGLPLPVELAFDEFSPDIIENQLIAGATCQLLRREELPMVIRNQLRRVGAQLLDVSPCHPSGSPPDVHFSRLNERYRSAVALAQLVLRSTSLDERAGATPGAGFLIDMNRVFEDVVGAGVRAAVGRGSGTAALQCELPLDRDCRLAIRPDVICRDRFGGVVAVADVKYKQPDLHGIAPGDIYQALAYAHRFGLGCVHLIYASPPPYGELQVGDVDVRLAWVDLALPAEGRQEQIDALAAEILPTAVLGRR